jgi:hypothetical protein
MEDTMTTPAPTAGQSQSQNQEQTITIGVEGSGDPVLEQRILRNVQSVGRQLGYLSAVVRVLLAERDASVKGARTPEAIKAVEDFERAQAAIDRAKWLREPERILEQWRRDKSGDLAHVSEFCSRLRAWLDQAEKHPL